jgi:hypothetical protein
VPSLLQRWKPTNPHNEAKKRKFIRRVPPKFEDLPVGMLVVHQGKLMLGKIVERKLVKKRNLLLEFYPGGPREWFSRYLLRLAYKTEIEESLYANDPLSLRGPN